MGLTQAMAAKMRPMPAEYNVEVVATGEVDMVTAGLATQAKQPEAARELLRFFSSPAVERILRSNGVEPFVE